MKILMNDVAGTLHLNVQIPNTEYGGYWPHLVDIYEPDVCSRAMVCLHGGSGTKTYQAKIMDVLKATPATASTVNWPLLKAFQCMMVYPQGQAARSTNALETASTPSTGDPTAHNLWNPSGIDTANTNFPQGVFTWSNGHHWGGYNDSAFLLDLAAYLRATFTELRGLSLHGHSDGGMMAMVMQMSFAKNDAGGNPYGYNNYLVTSGTIPILGASDNPGAYDIAALNYLAGAGNCPLWMQFGRADTVLGITGGVAGAGDHWSDPSYWSQQPDKISIANRDGTGYGMTGTGKFVPTLEHTTPGPIAWQKALDAWHTYYGGAAETYDYASAVVTTTPGRGDTLRTWTGAGGHLVLRLIDNAIHKYTDQQQSFGYPLLVDMLRWIDSLF